MLTLGLLIVLCVWGASALERWAGRASPGTDQVIVVEWEGSSEAPSDEVARFFLARGLRRDSFRLALYLAIFEPNTRWRSGSHIFVENESVKAWVRRLSGHAGRETVSVTFPEGWNLYQMAARLESLQVCTETAFIKQSRQAGLLHQLGISGESVEGYLFPAQYVFHVDSDPKKVIGKMVKAMQERLNALREREPEAWARLRARSWGVEQLLTLASIVQKESSHLADQRQVASVFYNRLDSEYFKPKERLQADPTAAYGCLVLQPRPKSCATYRRRRITPLMLRDKSNAYNTYQHAGLPPGPIGNPGMQAIEATLLPTSTDFLFFFANGRGRHRFSESLRDHNRVIRERVKMSGPEKKNAKSSTSR